VKEGFDLALTELTDVFLVQAGSPRGAELLCGLDCRPATSSELQRAADASARLSDQIQRRLRTHGLPELLLRNLEHPRWDAVAQRCLSCGNCTLVCPTCFCTTVNDSADLSGNSAARARLWDSCFTQDFSHVHGGNTRPMTRCRYRQWVTHKFASWAGQFGGLGCTGCGRCITWCPVGIDVAEEINAICEAAAP
jgi:ferredoxin